MNQWGVKTGVMVGDYIHDLEAGRSAGCITVHVGPRPPEAWVPSIDLSVRDCSALLSTMTC